MAGLSRLRSGLEWPWEGRTVTVWCKGFLKAHAALWKPAVRWALSAGGVKAGFVGRHRLLFTKDNYRERNGLGGPVPPHSSRSRHSSSRKTPGAPAHSQRSGGGDGGRVGANASSGIPRPIPREPAIPTSYGPARRGAALLCWGLSRRGAMRLCGERLGCMMVGVGACGWVVRVGWDCFLGPVRSRVLCL